MIQERAPASEGRRDPRRRRHLVILNAVGKPDAIKEPPECRFTFRDQGTGEDVRRSFEITQDEVVLCYGQMIDLCEIIDP
jgi:hypothetical protein